MVVAFIFVSKLFMAPSPYFLRSAAADPARDFFLGFWLVSACYSGPGSSFFPPLSLVHVEQHFTIIISSHRSTLKLLVGREKKKSSSSSSFPSSSPLYSWPVHKETNCCYIPCRCWYSAPFYIYIYISMGGILFIYSGDQKGGWTGEWNLAIWRVLNYETMLTGGGGLALLLFLRLSHKTFLFRPRILAINKLIDKHFLICWTFGSVAFVFFFS